MEDVHCRLRRLHGTFTGTDPSGATISAAISDAQVYFEAISTGSTPAYTFDVIAVFQSTTGDASGGSGTLNLTL
jgi:hypothetical protein